MLSEDGSVEIGFGLTLAVFGFIAPLFKDGNIWQNMTSIGSLTVFAAGAAVFAYGRHLRRKSERESKERIRRMIAEHLQDGTELSSVDWT